MALFTFGDNFLYHCHHVARCAAHDASEASLSINFNRSEASVPWASWMNL